MIDCKIALKGPAMHHLGSLGLFKPLALFAFLPLFSMCAAGAYVRCQASRLSLTLAYVAELEGLGENAARVDSTLSPLC